MVRRPVILVTGKNGQVGAALVPALTALGSVTAISHAECDLSDPASIDRAVRGTRPDIIVNAAAYTAVDKAESEKALAFAVNVEAPRQLAALASETGAALIHYSTDYVFDGRKPLPYVEDDPTAPLSVYGTSKRDGEIAVRDRLTDHLILRTSWVFGAHGVNFLKTMLRLAAERDSLRVVTDQIGAPTPAGLIARVTAQLVAAIVQGRTSVTFGTYHLTPSGETSWHGYATHAIERARMLGMPVRVLSGAIAAIPATEYPTPAARPANSRLDTAKLRTNFGIALPPWQDGVNEVLETLSAS